jgi:hypothetical protein
MSANRARFGLIALVLTACQEPLGPEPNAGRPVGLELATAPNVAAGSCPAPAPIGVIAWWRGEGDGADAAGTNPATAVGAVSYAPGHDGQAFSLQGGYLEVPDNAALDLGSSFSIDFWFLPRSIGSDWFEGLIGKRDPVTDVTNFGVNFNPAFLGFGAYYNDPAVVGGDDNDAVGSTFEAVRVLPAPAPGGFHHFAAVYRQATATEVELRVFIDGTLARSRTIPGNLAATVNDASLTLGASYPGFETFDGLLDEVRLFDHALTDVEVGQLANPVVNCDPPPPPAPPPPPPPLPPSAPLPLDIDIRPDGPANRIPCRSPAAVINVAVLSTAKFDARRLDPNEVFFGPGEATELRRDRRGNARPSVDDVNHDRRPDLVFHFRLGDTGLDCESTEATLDAIDVDGTEYEGTAGLGGPVQRLSKLRIVKHRHHRYRHGH